MLLFLVVMAVLAGFGVLGSGVFLVSSAGPCPLGWMSEQWLTEYRASQASP